MEKTSFTKQFMVSIIFEENTLNYFDKKYLMHTLLISKTVRIAVCYFK